MHSCSIWKEAKRDLFHHHRSIESLGRLLDISDGRCLFAVVFMHPNILQAAIEKVCHADRGEGAEVGRHRIFSYSTRRSDVPSARMISAWRVMGRSSVGLAAAFCSAIRC